MIFIFDATSVIVYKGGPAYFCGRNPFTKISMKKKKLISLLLFFLAIATQAQNITVKGIVVSSTDAEPLIGANVVSAAKRSNATTTDFDGKFTIVVPEGSNLIISYIGYGTATVKATPNMTITLKDNSVVN